MDYNVLKAAIAAYVKDRTGLDTIDGDGLQETLLAIVNSIGAGYVFMGVADLTTNPGTPDQRVWYLAATAGIYANFDNTVLGQYEIAVLKWDTEWHKEAIPDIPSKSQIDERLDEQDGRLNGQDARLDGQDEEIADFEGAVRNMVENYPNITIDGDVVNAPDQEDITTDENDLLKFANRPAVNGMGYIILRKGKTFSEQVTEQNTIYEIRYDFDLDGASVSIPSGCVLKFDGGVVSNGTLVGNDTRIIYKGPIFTEISISGTWDVPVLYSYMFTDIESNHLKDLFAFANDNQHNKVVIDNKTYSVEIDGDGIGVNYVVVAKNTDVQLNGTVNLVPFYGEQGLVYGYRVFLLKENVRISGSGTIKGDLLTSEAKTTESGSGVYTHASNVVIEGIKIKDCYGDCIDISGGGNIRISNVELSNWYRNAISLVSGDNVIIENCVIHDGGLTAPMTGIDIEPNANGVVSNVTIKEIVAYNIPGFLDCNSWATNSYINNIVVENVKCNNCGYFGHFIKDADDEKKCEHKNIRLSNIQIDNLPEPESDTYQGYILRVDGVDNVKIWNINASVSFEKNVPAFFLRGIVNAIVENCNVLARILFNLSDGVILKGCKCVARYLFYGHASNISIYNSFIDANVQINNGCLIKDSIFKITRQIGNYINIHLYGDDNICIGNLFDGDTALGNLGNKVTPIEIDGKRNTIAFNKFDAHSGAFNATTGYIQLINTSELNFVDHNIFLNYVSSDRRIADASGLNILVGRFKNRGNLQDRPTLPNVYYDASVVGFRYFALDVAKPIFHTGTKWVYADGTDV